MSRSNFIPNALKFMGQNTLLFELKIHMEYSFGCLGHLTKMAATPVSIVKHVSMISLS